MKPTIFISHISTEHELATYLGAFIEDVFQGQARVFVSSDAQSLRTGDEWFPQIIQELRDCAALLLLCSKVSSERPWINFEAGVVAHRKDRMTAPPLIPLCYSGLDKGNLHSPLNEYQAMNLADKVQFQQVLKILSEATGLELVDKDLDAFLADVRVIEARYIFWDNCNEHFRILRGVLGEHYVARLNVEQLNIEIPVRDYQKILASLEYLQNNQIILFKETGQTYGPAKIIFILAKGERFDEITGHEYFERS